MILMMLRGLLFNENVILLLRGWWEYKYVWVL